MTADLILRRGRVLTPDAAGTIAGSLACRAGRILAIAPDAEIAPLAAPDTTVIELDGGLVLPGFIDGHAHLLDYGQSLETVDLLGTRNFTELVERVAQRARHTLPGEWILGRGWDHTRWPGAAYPHHAALSAVTPLNPVLLGRVDGHAAIANAAALHLTGVDAATADPPGGHLLRETDGSPTGVLVESAQRLVRDAVPPLTAHQRRRMLKRGADACLAVGLTGLHDAIEHPHFIDDYRALLADDALDVRIFGMLSDRAGDDLDSYLAANRVEGDGFLQVRCLRLILDGGLGARGAALTAPYADDPTTAGYLMIPAERVTAAARAALRQGFQLCTHAIGDRANRIVLDAYERVLREAGHRDARFLIEHAQVVDPADAPRFGALGVGASIQPRHALSDLPWTAKRLGLERAGNTYAFRRLVEGGAMLVAGSDFPVEPPDPLDGLQAAVTRRNADGEWFPDQGLTLAEALRAYTLGGAWAAFRETQIGTLAPGKRADLVVLNRDILAGPAEEIAAARPVLTMVDGRIRSDRR